MVDTQGALVGQEPGRRWVLPFREVGGRDVPVVGGKGAQLGELAAAGLPVPPGFCVTTEAFELFMSAHPRRQALLAELDGLSPEDVEGVRRVGARVRQELLELPVPQSVARAVVAAWRQLGEEYTYAVRSSATLEDLPDASFAGQQDTYLNVKGEHDLVDKVRACWVSLFTDRAILYRRQQGFASALAKLAVVVQRMVKPDVSGILFTADPVSGHRGICSIDASYGLGEALVSGLVDADLYRVRKATGALVEVRVGKKEMAIHPLPQGGTERRPVPEDKRQARSLDEATLARLVELGQRIEVLKGSPQDIEWCVEAGEVYIVQARAITTLYPIPEPRPSDGALHLYMSFGHIQVNTAVLSPLGMSIFAMVFPIARRGPQGRSELVKQAGGRLFVDTTPILLRAPFSRLVPQALDNMISGVGDRQRAVIARPEFQAGRAKGVAVSLSSLRLLARLLGRVAGRMLKEPVQLRARFDSWFKASLGDITRHLRATEPGAPRLRAFRQLVSQFFERMFFAEAIPTLAPGLLSWVILIKLLGDRAERRTLQALTRGFEGNVTTQMDLELGDLGDLARQVPEVARHLEQAEPARAIEGLRGIAGSGPFLEGWERFIQRYGHRCAGEIDIAVTRWAEDPSSLVRNLVGMLKAEESGLHRKRHAAAAREADQAAAELLEVAGQGVLGGVRQWVVRGLIARVRALLALREHPKFLIMHLFYQGHQAIQEAGRLAVERGWLERAEDVWMLDFDELLAALEGSPQGLKEKVAQRRAEWKRYERLSPPPLITSEGEVPAPLVPTEQPPPGVLVGMAASSGVVEGVARVVLDPARETLHAGEILVAPFTDPGWTPLFVHAKGLVMEVGGLMTHGSVVAREYGLPAVVGVEGATQKIRTGQRLRVDGDRGRVTLLEASLPLE